MVLRYIIMFPSCCIHEHRNIVEGFGPQCQKDLFRLAVELQKREEMCLVEDSSSYAEQAFELIANEFCCRRRK